MIKILAFAGSTRADSYNKKILSLAVYGARDAGAEVTVIDLKDFNLPLYDGDLEASEGLPSNAKKLKKIFTEHHGLLLALPEYNSSMSGVFKNAIDWVSRQEQNEAPLHCFTGKIAALMSASIGGFGGVRGLAHARSMLENINTLVIPDQVTVSNSQTAFDEYGNLKNEITIKSLTKLGANLVNLTLRLGSHLD